MLGPTVGWEAGAGPCLRNRLVRIRREAYSNYRVWGQALVLITGLWCTKTQDWVHILKDVFGNSNVLTMDPSSVG